MIGIAVSLTLIIILFRHMFIKKPFKILFPFILMITVGFALNSITEGRVTSRLNQSIYLKRLRMQKHMQILKHSLHD